MTKRFWFGENTKIDLPGEYPGVIPTPAWAAENVKDFNWSVSATVNVSIGQGLVKMTPLQLALNTAAIANKGTVWKPRLVKEILDEDGEAESKPKVDKLREMKVSGHDFDVAREGMRRVVHEETGSAHHDTLDDFSKVSKWPYTNPKGEDEILLGGKTGTAEVGEPNEAGIYERQHAWFTCFAPYDDPEIALTVLVEDGGEGSAYAVPIADRILRAYFETTGRRDRGKILTKDGDGLADIDNLFPKPGVTQVSAQD
jgi:penicillin-binding protein 2